MTRRRNAAKHQSRFRNTMRKRSVKAGLPPGSLTVPPGELASPARISSIWFNGERFQESDLSVDDVEQLDLSREGVLWLSLTGLRDPAAVERTGARFGLHPLVMEDILNTSQRPKVEEYPDYIFIVLRSLLRNPVDGSLGSEQVSIVFGRNFLLTFQEIPVDCFGPVLERLRLGKGRMRLEGADFLAYSLLDAVVDHYFVLLDTFTSGIDELQDELLNQPTPEALSRIHGMRAEFLEVRDALWPLRELVVAWQHLGEGLVNPATQIYLRDVHDHVLLMIDTLASVREVLAGMVEIYLTTVSNRMNEIMKVLTVIATIFIPLTFITSLYGMNFKHMPELDSPCGYPAVLLLMVVIGVGQLLYFRRRHWF